MDNDLLAQAKDTLKLNDRKLWTVPAPDIYPHQWLWDSCFVAIGLRHLDITRAQTELTSLLRGQWSNGMLPNMIFADGAKYRRDRHLWDSQKSSYAPDKVSTSGLTQPPMLAEAVVRVGQKLKKPERRSWYAQMYPSLLAYHQWIYKERDPSNQGLAVLLHPYECGMDNSPPWTSELYRYAMPWWIRLIGKLRLDALARFFRRDTHFVPADHRTNDIESLAYIMTLLRLRRRAYDSQTILKHPKFAVEDLGFNCILVRANNLLQDMAELIGQKIPDELRANMANTAKNLEQLWDEKSGYYYSRSYISQQLIQEPTVASLLPLYAGCITKERAQTLVDNLLKRQRRFGTSWPVPSVPVNSPYFNPALYWQGPTWINTNWLIIYGLRRYGFEEEAQKLTARTLELLTKSGTNEYFNPLNGEPDGTANFSWTAALTIDLLNS